MFRSLRWIKDTGWCTVWGLSIICSLTLPLVFAGTVNDSVDQRTKTEAQSQQGAGRSMHSSSFPIHVPSSSPSLEKKEEVSLLLDLSENLLLVKRGDHVIYTALAATGSGKVLHDPRHPSRKWKFETPRGKFTIESKLKKPVWIRPDWAFIEKGVAVPKDRGRRLLPNVLGDYALGFGDGYFIHGALYTYLLGFNVTHGCIQLNDDDLRFVFETVPVGAKLVIV